MPFKQREKWAWANLAPVETDLRIVWEPDVDAPISVFVPAARWMAMALHGHIIEDDNGTPLGPLTEEEAIEYLIPKIMPKLIWDSPGNRRRFAVCLRQHIPETRDFRDAWRLNEDATQSA